MNTQQLELSVKSNEFMRNWLVSDVIEVPFLAKPDIMHFNNYHPGADVKDELGKEIRSPAKKQFIQADSFCKSSYPEKIKMQKLYCPFDTSRVDFSEFWTFPTEITFYARLSIKSNAAHKHPFCLYACGAAKVWVNKQLQAEFYPYESNIEQTKKIELSLDSGLNEIVVGCNDYGERNIVFEFGLQNIGDALDISLSVNADFKKIASVDKTLRSIYTDKLSYQSGKIIAIATEPFEDDTDLEINICETVINYKAKRGEKSFDIIDVSKLPIGYHPIEIYTTVDGVKLGTTLMAECYPNHLYAPHIKDYEERKNVILKFALNNTPPSLERYIVGLYFGENQYEANKVAVDEALRHVNKRGDCSDFRTLKFFWLLKKFSHLLDANLLKSLETALLQFRYWFDEKGNDAMWFFSENHALCFHVSEMLAGEMFADEVFSNSGMTGREHAAKAKKLIVEWFEKLLRYGYNEWNSAAYITVDMLSYITLFTLGQDDEVRMLAKKALDFTFELFAKNSFKGVLGTSNGRTYPRDLLANRCLASNAQIWLAWGEGYLNQQINPAIYLALSQYEPPHNLQEIANWDKSQRFIHTEVQGTKQVETTLCKTNSYILGTCISPRTGNLGSQEHLINIFLHDAETRIWINHPGEGKIWGQKRPGYMTGNGLTPLVTQHENVAIMSYCFLPNLIKRAEVNFTHAMCDISLMDNVVVEDKWIFAQKGDAFAALFAFNGVTINQTAPLKEKEFISYGLTNTWFIKVSSKSEISSFDLFVKTMQSNQPSINNYVLEYKDFELGNLKFDLMKEDYLRTVTHLK